MRRIDEVMSSGPLISVGPETKVADAVRLIGECEVSHLLVFDGPRLLGVVCICDLDRADRCAEVAACMSAPPLVVESGASAFEAARCMIEHGVSCLPVMRDGRLAGVATASDLRRAGVLARSPGRCAACGSDDHVRTGCAHGVAFCFDCMRRAVPPSWDEETGVAG